MLLHPIAPRAGFATLLTACLFLVNQLPLVSASEVKEKFLAEGVTARVGGYRPIRAEMDQDASIAEKLPEGLTAPKFGYLKFGDQQWAFVLDEPEEGGAKLWVDTNGDKDLTNDPTTKWSVREGSTTYSGGGSIELAPRRVAKFNAYRFDPTDKARAVLANTLMYYADFGSEFTFELDGKEFSTFVAGSLSESARLPVDRDGNGRTSSRLEVATVGKPFNFTGTTYVFSASEGKLTLEKADEPVEMTPLPPDVAIGKPALVFKATTMDGHAVDFPSSYKGRIVMLDFWATWCGPCIGEIPHMKAAYAEWHEKGFDILGVSFDGENDLEKVQKFLTEKEISWQQIFEGKGWQTSLGLQYDVTGIPFVLLVDGDTGEILANAAQLRGEQLTEFIGKKLEEKSGKTE